MTIRPTDQLAPVEKLLHLANQAHQDKLYALAGYFTSMCFKVGDSPHKRPQQIRQAKKDSHNPFHP